VNRRSRASALPDRELLQALRLLVEDVRALDLCAARSLSREGDEPLDGCFLAFENRFHRSVPVVPHPARNAVLLRERPRRVPEEDPLHAAVDNHSFSHRRRRLRAVRTTSEFVARLAAAHIGDTFNFYRDGERADIRRERLHDYLEHRRGAGLLLVGEAAGYRGARVSGIPFTSERQLTGRDPAEASATIVHRVLADLGLADDVLLWNLVPTHPHLPGRPDTNRRPTRAEIDGGRAFLIELSRGRRVVAVGRLAHSVLGGTYVRHPSHGGAAAFAAGLARITGPLGA
jgi:hypothetical protein